MLPRPYPQNSAGEQRPRRQRVAGRVQLRTMRHQQIFGHNRYRSRDMGWGQTSLGFELLWGSRHDGGYPALHLLRQVVSGCLQTNGFVTWGVAKEGGSDPERMRFRPVVEVSAGVDGVVAAAMGAGTSLPGRGGEVEDAEASAMTESVWCVSGADRESAYQRG